MTIRTLLVANRGEIARRIFRTCRRLGIRTAAVFSDADADMPFVREADVAVRIGPAAATESYLVIDKIIDAAVRVGADAVHPGYGFLAESADLVEACGDAGLTFVGPGPAAMRAMGLKREAKQAVAAAGVPVVPGYDGPTDDETVVATEAGRIGYPVLVKASAGGGGKGMRIVRDAGELPGALEAAAREAASSFGDATLILEKYVEGPRHVEIQVLADAHGSVIHLFERECSIQRRHQKIIEESPSPAVDDDLRARMGEAAVMAARAIGYVNAGTVEFILAPDGSFYFLEMNTRLQVEHPVTEAVTGLDLVELQLSIAEEVPLGLAQEQVQQTGAAIECRLYAEDVDAGFLPATGVLAAWTGRVQEGVRVDAGVEAGDEISVHYDPMIAKVITHAGTREQARRKMVSALRRMSLAGVVTNRAFLARVLEHPSFVAGDIDTHFVPDHADALSGEDEAARGRVGAAIAAALHEHESRRAERTLLPSMEPGFRNVFNASQSLSFDHGGVVLAVHYRNLGGGRFDVRVGGAGDDAEPTMVAVVAADESGITLEADGVRRRFEVALHGLTRTVLADGLETILQRLPRFPDASAEVEAGGCHAPMPGKIVAVRVEVGDVVVDGAELVVMEAMKMEHTIRAPEAGEVAEVRVQVGDQVDGDTVLVVLGSGD